MNSHKKMRLGIISALHEEQQGLVEAMQGPQRRSHGMRDYTLGTLWNIDAVCVLSRLGKVAAAMTASILVEKYGVTHIVFTGVAGSGDKHVKVGDIVVAEALLQHDMDARPLFPRFEVPLTGLQRFATDLELSTQLAAAAEDFLRDDVSSVLKAADIVAIWLAARASAPRPDRQRRPVHQQRRAYEPAESGYSRFAGRRNGRRRRGASVF